SKENYKMPSKKVKSVSFSDVMTTEVYQNGETCTVKENTLKTSGLSDYVVALRPWSFTASLTPVALGSVLAYKMTGDFNIWIVIVTCITALAVHAAGNLVNTYFDYVKGVDSKKSDDRTLVDHLLAPDEVARLGGIFYIIGCCGFVVMTILSPTKMEHLALLYFGGLSASFLYTGGLGLKYVALGDILIFISFGPITVLFAFLAQGGELSLLPMAYAIPVALNTEAILHSNNVRDFESDKAAGIVTLPILIGKTASYVVFALLIFGPPAIFAVMTVKFNPWCFLPTLTMLMALKAEKMFRTGKLALLPHYIAQMNLILGFLYIVAIYMSSSAQLPGF
ncbi:unnamed protein product, partial [Owenia fusiformis]